MIKTCGREASPSREKSRTRIDPYLVPGVLSASARRIGIARAKGRDRRHYRAALRARMFVRAALDSHRIPGAGRNRRDGK